MLYAVTTVRDVSFQPTSEREEILQNVRTILATRKGSVPLDRDLGITWEHLDKPYPVARSLMTAAVIEAVETYEPRVRVESVEFEGTESEAMDGLIRPRVIVYILNEGED